MRVRVVSVGRDRDFTAAGSAEYAERLKRACAIELVELRAESGPAGGRARRQGDPRRRRQRQGAGRALGALTSRGRELSSEELAAAHRPAARSRRWGSALCIGGDEGLSPEVREAVRFSWSPLALDACRTGSRGWSCSEQVYRAFEILRRGAYHK